MSQNSERWRPTVVQESPSQPPQVVRESPPVEPIDPIHAPVPFLDVTNSMTLLESQASVDDSLRDAAWLNVTQPFTQDHLERGSDLAAFDGQRSVSEIDQSSDTSTNVSSPLNESSIVSAGWETGSSLEKIESPEAFRLDRAFSDSQFSGSLDQVELELIDARL